MTLPSDPQSNEQHAAKRFAILSAIRVAGLAVLMLGIAIAQNAVEAPYWVGVVLSVGGMLAFFFGPYFLARRWKNERADPPQ